MSEAALQYWKPKDGAPLLRSPIPPRNRLCMVEFSGAPLSREIGFDKVLFDGASSGEDAEGIDSFWTAPLLCVGTERLFANSINRLMFELFPSPAEFGVTEELSRSVSIALSRFFDVRSMGPAFAMVSATHLLQSRAGLQNNLRADRSSGHSREAGDRSGEFDKSMGESNRSLPIGEFRFRYLPRGEKRLIKPTLLHARRAVQLGTNRPSQMIRTVSLAPERSQDREYVRGVVPAGATTVHTPSAVVSTPMLIFGRVLGPTKRSSQWLDTLVICGAPTRPRIESVVAITRWTHQIEVFLALNPVAYSLLRAAEVVSLLKSVDAYPTTE